MHFLIVSGHRRAFLGTGGHFLDPGGHNLAPSMFSQAWVGILVTLEGIIVGWACILEHE